MRAQQQEQALTAVPTNSIALSLAREQRNAALVDLREGLLRWPLWLTIGWLEIRQRYRRSLIGPFWITLSVAIFVGSIAIVYSALLRMKITDYLPYLTCGIVIWTFLSSILLEGCTVFIVSEGAIKQNPVPLSVHVYRLILRNLIILGHNALIYVLLILVFPIQVSFALLTLPIALTVAAAAGVGLILILGILSTRFRDIPLIVTSLIQVLFFTTPILWRPETLPADRRWVADANPFYHLIEIQRAPLLGHYPALESYAVATAFAVATLACGILLYTYFHKRIAYWL